MDWQKYPKSRTSIRIRQPETLDSIKCHTFPGIGGQTWDILLRNSTLQFFGVPKVLIEPTHTNSFILCALNRISMHTVCILCAINVIGVHVVCIVCAACVFVKRLKTHFLGLYDSSSVQHLTLLTGQPEDPGGAAGNRQRGQGQ
jgi:hypothetical protein